MVNCYSEKHEFESVSGVVGVQGLDQGGNCESRLLSFQLLITNSRLGELFFCACELHDMCMVLCHAF